MRAQSTTSRPEIGFIGFCLTFILEEKCKVYPSIYSKFKVRKGCLRPLKSKHFQFKKTIHIQDLNNYKSADKL